LPRFLICLSLLVVLAALSGCKQGPLPTPQEKAQSLLKDYMSPEHKKVLEGILEQQEKTGDTLNSLAKEMARREAIEAVSKGPSPLQQDFGVARGLLVDIRRAVNSNDYETASNLLKRLQFVVIAMQGEAPAGQIRSYLERASRALTATTVGIEADVASASLLAALDIALDTQNAPVIPDLARDIEATKKLVDSGDYKKAIAKVDAFIGTIATHRSLVTLERALDGVRGAREAIQREAGTVVLAELDQLSEIFNQFGKFLKGGVVAPTEETDAGEAKPAESAEKEATEKPSAESPEGSPGASPETPAETPAQ